MLLATLLAVVCATLLPTAAPYAAGAATSRDLESQSKMLLSLPTDDMDDGEDVAMDTVDSPADDDFDLEDEGLPLRELRTKNFLRFGRSSSGGGAATKSRQMKEGSSARFNRGEPDDNFIRLGRSNADEAKAPVTRSANSNFIRLGRARTEPNNFIRLGRARTEPNNFIRLGRVRTEPNNFIRLGRDRTQPSNFIRLGRARTEPSNFIRLGRARTEPSNFIRLGRGNQDFIRFGRGGNEELIDLTNLENNATLARLARDSNFIRLGRLPNSDFIRLGRLDNALRFDEADNYLRFGRGSPDNFIRFGRGKSEALFGRGKLTDRNFIRLGRSGLQFPEDVSLTGAKDVKPTTGRIPGVDETNDRFGRDLEHIDEKRRVKNVRRKRSLLDEDDEETNAADLQYQYYSSGGHVPFAPELTVLPSFYTKRTTGGGNGNFIRLG